jgi:hypothetical protein
MEVLVKLLFASSFLVLLAVALALFGLVGLVLRWVIGVWGGGLSRHR